MLFPYGNVSRREITSIKRICAKNPICDFPQGNDITVLQECRNTVLWEYGFTDVISLRECFPQGNNICKTDMRKEPYLRFPAGKRHYGFAVMQKYGFMEIRFS